MEIPELFRCGWAIIQLDEHLWPVRALHGALPGPLQYVGRAERWAALQALRHCQGMDEYVADLLSLVQEGREWHQRHASSKGKHAAIWRAMLHAQADRQEPPPDFQWGGEWRYRPSPLDWQPVGRLLREAMCPAVSGCSRRGPATCWPSCSYAGSGEGPGVKRYRRPYRKTERDATRNRAIALFWVASIVCLSCFLFAHG